MLWWPGGVTVQAVEHLRLQALGKPAASPAGVGADEVVRAPVNALVALLASAKSSVTDIISRAELLLSLLPAMAMVPVTPVPSAAPRSRVSSNADAAMLSGVADVAAASGGPASTSGSPASVLVAPPSIPLGRSKTSAVGAMRQHAINAQLEAGTGPPCLACWWSAARLQIV